LYSLYLSPGKEEEEEDGKKSMVRKRRVKGHTNKKD